MKKIVFAIFTIGPLQNLCAQDNAVETLKKLNQGFLNSILKKDSATLSGILADDFILVNPAGLKRTKKDNLESTVAPNIQFSAINIDSVDVRIITPDVGIVTCFTSFVYKADGKDGQGRNDYQDVYVRRRGRWYAVSARVTLLPAK
jgi:hypothetical protein